jgi:hypothetical protein
VESDDSAGNPLRSLARGRYRQAEVGNLPMLTHYSRLGLFSGI